MSRQNPGGLPCLSSRASGTSRGISNPEPLPLWKVEPCLGADHTKEFLSFEKQPSFFKGRNQSWFHPLRTPSRPGAAAPGPRRGQWAVVGFSANQRPAAMHRPPAARFRDSFAIVSLFESKPKDRPPNSSASSMEIPPIAAARLRRDDRQGQPPGFQGVAAQ